MKRIFLLLFALNSLFSHSQELIEQNGLKTFVTNDLSAGGTQAKRYEIATVGYNSHNWQNGGIIIVELFQSYFGTGYEKYIIEIGYQQGTDATSPKITLSESAGNYHNAKITLGTPNDLSTYVGEYVNKAMPIYLDVKDYSRYKAKITTVRDITLEVTQYNQIVLNKAPSPSDIDDFTLDEFEGISSGEIQFNHEYYNFSSEPRTQISPLSIKLFDDYKGLRPGEVAPGNNNYGTLLDLMGREGHWEHNLYFGANNQLWFRTSTWSGGIAEDGTTGGFNKWRRVLDTKTDVETTGNLQITGSGTHYISNGNVGIGCTSPDAKLVVKGTIKATEIKVVDGSALPCSDYVFENDYNLRSLEDVESFVQENKHLPEVPSAQEFKENGYSIGEMDDILLRKIEELTLYVIEKDKEIRALKKENQVLKDDNSVIKDLAKRIEKLEMNN